MLVCIHSYLGWGYLFVYSLLNCLGLACIVYCLSYVFCTLSGHTCYMGTVGMVTCT